MKHRSISLHLVIFIFVTITVGWQPRVLAQDRAGVGAPDSNAAASRIAVLGSSVAAGWVTSYRSRHDLENGYAYRLGRLLAPRGYTVTNVSIPGNSTADVLARMGRDLDPIDPGFVVIGLSLGNERLDRDRDAAVAAYRANLPAIIDSCRAAGRIPVVGLCYPYDRYSSVDYRYLKRMNLEINDWGVAAINFLGALDDGHGHFVDGYTFDEGHPDNRGHEEMFLAIVPSLFDALRDGRPAPARTAGSGHTTIVDGGDTPLSYVPDDPVHSFATGFTVRTPRGGALAAVNTGGGFAVLSVDGDGRLVYRTGGGDRVEAAQHLADDRWHDVVVSHRYLARQTLIFVDGAIAARATERIEPRQFVLGGSGDGSVAPPPRADYRDWLVYRAALNDDEAAYLHGGGLFTASMEVFAPLSAGKLSPDRTVENRAWSTSRVLAQPSETPRDLAALEKKIEAARVERENEFVAGEKPVVPVAPEVLAAYAGRYEIAPGNVVTIASEGDRLFVIAEGDSVPLYAESTNRFFIKTVDEIVLEFVKNAGGAVDTLKVSMHGQQIPAKRTED